MAHRPELASTRHTPVGLRLVRRAPLAAGTARSGSRMQRPTAAVTALHAPGWPGAATAWARQPSVDLRRRGQCGGGGRGSGGGVSAPSAGVQLMSRSLRTVRLAVRALASSSASLRGPGLRRERGAASVLYSDRRADQAIGRIDRGADQNEGLKGTLGAARPQRSLRLSSPAAAARGSESGPSAAAGPDAGEVQRRVKHAANVIATAHMLVSSDPGGFNAALLVWKAIAAIPAHARHQLLDVITSADMVRLWRLSAQRYKAGANEALAAVGPFYNMLDEFPDSPGQVFTYEGRAAMPAGLRLKFADRFRKVFFTGKDPEQLFGRVELGKGPLVDALYPLYFRVNVQPSIVPATSEITDVQLEYLDPYSIGLTREEIPKGGWPSPGTQRWPFSGGLTDHMRAVGPGCWCGVGWKAPRPGVDVGRRFFTFMLLRRHDKG